MLGNGRVRLLQAIDEQGSITAAARSMGMSYKKAWAQIDGMNAVSAQPLVEKSAGGKNGGGAMVTEHGKNLIDKFLHIKEACGTLISQKEKEEKFK